MSESEHEGDAPGAFEQGLFVADVRARLGQLERECAQLHRAQERADGRFDTLDERHATTHQALADQGATLTQVARHLEEMAGARAEQRQQSGALYTALVVAVLTGAITAVAAKGMDVWAAPHALRNTITLALLVLVAGGLVLWFALRRR